MFLKQAVLTKDQIIIVALLVSVVTSILYISTAWGTGTTPDSIEYLLAAKALINPSESSFINAHWAPLYPVLLGVSIAIFDNLIESARWLHIILFGLNTLLFFVIALRVTKLSNLFATITTLAFSLSPISLNIHYMMWSEVPFMTTLLLLILSFYYWVGHKTNRTLVYIAILLATLCLIRYAGVAFVGSFCLFLFLSTKGKVLPRLVRFSILGIVSVLPTFLFMWVANLHTETTATRHITVHIIDWTRVSSVPRLLLQWFAGEQAALSYIMLLVISVSMVNLIRQRSSCNTKLPKKKLGLFLSLTPFLYILFLFVSISFLDYYTPIDNRLLFPIWPFFLLLIVLALQSIRNYKIRRLAIALFFIPLLAIGIPYSLENTIGRTQMGSGFLSPRFRHQPIMAVTAHLCDTIYSNAPNVIKLYWGYDAQELPRIFDPVNTEPYPFFEDEMNIVITQCLNGNARIVYFNALAWRQYYPNKSYLLEKLSSVITYDGDDGVIFDNTSTTMD